MKFLVLGCNGMAGHIVSLYLYENGHEVTGFAREKSSLVNSIVGDATNLEDVKSAINSNEFDAVVNCIGLLNQFAENNKTEAVLLNSFLPHYLVKLTEGTKAQVIHISTDCVFSGKRGQYTESDLRDGETFYDRTKALGELNDDKNLTLRQSIVGPDIKSEGIGLLNWFMKQQGEINGYTKAIWTGQTTLQLAKTVEAAATDHAYGLVNAVPDESITKFDLLCLFNKYLREDKNSIVPNDTVVADKSLKRTNFVFEYSIPGYDTMVSELAGWMKEHKELYPHYNL